MRHFKTAYAHVLLTATETVIKSAIAIATCTSAEFKVQRAKGRGGSHEQG